MARRSFTPSRDRPRALLCLTALLGACSTNENADPQTDATDATEDAIATSDGRDTGTLADAIADVPADAGDSSSLADGDADGGAAPPPPVPLLPGGRFGFAYPNFTGAAGAMTPTQYVDVFAATMHNPNVYRSWLAAGIDIRRLNPRGAYLKHISLRTIDSTQLEPSIEGHPDYAWIHKNHPEWILRDATGKTVPLFIATEEMLDFGNDAYLDWVLSTWMPENYLDATDADPKVLTWYLQDNGVFDAMSIKCATGDSVCARYTTDEGVRTAWEHMLDRFKARWPNKKILTNSVPVTYKPVADQLVVLERILTHADGYFGEAFTNDHASWSAASNDGKRVALAVTMQLASWLADHEKAFFPNLGMADGQEPTQTEVDYAWAFFNVLRKGELQFFTRVTKDGAGMWQPRTYPEMTKPIGVPTEAALETSPNVWRRTYERAIAYVNLSDAPVTITLPAGLSFTDAAGKAVASPLTLASFRGLTAYH